MRLILLILAVVLLSLPTMAQAERTSTERSYSLLAWPDISCWLDRHWLLDPEPFTSHYHHQYRQQPLPRYDYLYPQRPTPQCNYPPSYWRLR